MHPSAELDTVGAGTLGELGLEIASRGGNHVGRRVVQEDTRVTGLQHSPGHGGEVGGGSGDRQQRLLAADLDVAPSAAVSRGRASSSRPSENGPRCGSGSSDWYPRLRQRAQGRGVRQGELLDLVAGGHTATASRPPGRVAPARCQNAAIGSAKNITPKREITASKCAAGRATSVASRRASAPLAPAPSAVASTGPATTGRPQASAVSWHSSSLRARRRRCARRRRRGR